MQLRHWLDSVIGQGHPAIAAYKRLGGALPLPVLLAFLLLQPGEARAELRLKRIMHLFPSAMSFPEDCHPIADMDHDGLLEMAYKTGRNDSMTTNPERWEYGRFLPFNRWRLLYADTVVWPPPNGLQPACFTPAAMGDADHDGLSEILGHCCIWFTDSSGFLGDTEVLCTMEQRSSSGPPDSITWLYFVSRNGPTEVTPYMPGRLDQDSLDDFLTWTDSVGGHVMLENRGDNSYVHAWTAPGRIVEGWSLAFGDCDMDGRVEFMGGWLSGRVVFWETTGDDQYQCVFEDTVDEPNAGHDCFFGRDVNRNGKPEFFQTLARYMGGPLDSWTLYLFMWEAVADNRYARTCVDSVLVTCTLPCGQSACGDLDGDGVEELVWNTVTDVAIYRASPSGILRRVGSWYNSHDPSHQFPVNVNIADVNYDGYNEVLIGCRCQISVIEVEAIRVLAPNRRATYQPGDTCRVSWQTYSPPRCDSVSLFLRRDTTYQLDTIAHGLTPDDTPYVWVVPNIRADSAYVMAIAYGPGWQYDESDNAFQIRGTGIGEEKSLRIRELRLSVTPNPTTGTVGISYDLPASVPVEVSVLDLSGRRTTTLASGRLGPGRYQARWNRTDAHGRTYPSGVYYVQLKAGGVTRMVKLVVMEDR